MAAISIPFNRPSLTGKELEYIAEALRAGHAAGDGPFAARCQALLEEMLGVPKVLLTTSCTHALELCALLLDLEPGDEVIMPSFTFVSTANAFALRDARPVFCDIRADTLNIDERIIESLVTARTRAIVVVHYAGVASEMREILRIADKHDLAVIEDNAHGLMGRYRGRPLGTFGRLATQSFHETKNIVCGEGGALLINDERLSERAEILREKGTNRSQFFRGEVDRYTWVDLGSSYAISDILAAFLLAQLEAAEGIQEKRRALWKRYEEGLRQWAEEEDVVLPTVPAHCDSSHHMFHVLMPDAAARGRAIAHLEERGVLGVFHYVPLHTSPRGLALGGSPGDCPVTEDVSERLLRLPFYNDLDEVRQQTVIDALASFHCASAAVSVD